MCKRLEKVRGLRYLVAWTDIFSTLQKKIRYLVNAAAGSRMSVKNKKQFGIWMDNHHATVIGRAASEEFSVLGHAENPAAGGNSNENAAHNLVRTQLNQFFKKITSHMQNADEVHVTGTGTVQEQFIHYLAETPQFKNTVAKECTSNKMSDEQLVKFINDKFN